MARPVTRAEAILADPLAGARTAERAIAFVGFDVPADLLAASGRTPCHLPWDAETITPRADAWLETSFPRWAHSMLEQWAEGAFDCFEAVVFSRGEDAAQRLYYYACELRRRGAIAGPEPLILDLARIPRATSAARTVSAVRGLAERLNISNDALAAGIHATNRRRALLESLEAGRGAGGAAYEAIARASLFASVEDLLAGFVPPTGDPRGRVLLAGTAPPDGRLHRAVEAAGWSVTGEATDLSLRRLGPAIDPGSDPAAAIGAQVHARALGARSFADRAPLLMRDAARARADAVILWLIEEEEALVWQLPAQLRTLEAAGVPALALTRRRWDARDGAADEIAAFLEGLGR